MKLLQTSVLVALPVLAVLVLVGTCSGPSVKSAAEDVTGESPAPVIERADLQDSASATSGATSAREAAATAELGAALPELRLQRESGLGRLHRGLHDGAVRVEDRGFDPRVTDLRVPRTHLAALSHPRGAGGP